MELKIITDIENPLFDRREIQGEIKTEINPSREEVIQLISEKIKTPIENIKIKTIQAKFGSKIFIIVANIYSSETGKKKIERMSKKEKEAEEKSKQQTEEISAEEPATEIEKIPEQQKPVKEDKLTEEPKKEVKEEAKREDKEEDKE